MSVITGQKLASLFEEYKGIDVTFTKEVAKLVHLRSDQIYLKFLGTQLPCVIYSISMVGAKVVANIRNKEFQELRKAGSKVALRLAFSEDSRTDPLSFFITSKIDGFNPYSRENPEVAFISLKFTQHPPDDLIQILGLLLEVNVNSKRRREERIQVDEDVPRKLGMNLKETVLYIQGIPRKCIVRDLSFSGARFIIAGMSRFLQDKEGILKMTLVPENKVISIKVHIVRVESVQNHDDLTVAAVQFDPETVPMDYKLRLNDYFNSKRNQKPVE